MEVKTNNYFDFRRCVTILKATGKKAKNLRELRDLLEVVSDNSIVHHTFHYFLKGHILEFTNDFAEWAGNYLEERSLSEQLSNIDPYTFKDINELRKTLIETIDDFLELFPEPREVPPGNEFYFNETITLVFPVGIKVKNLAEFLIAIRYVDDECIYYHFYEARTRLGDSIDDFSMWIEHALNKKTLAEKIRSIDPFMHNIEGIRRHIIDAVEEEVKRDMEEVV